MVYPYREKTALFCSRKCKGIHKRGEGSWNKGIQHKEKIICPICEKEFERYPSRKAKFCSPECQAIGRIGIKRPDVSDRMKKNKHTIGYKHTEEAKRKISEASKRQGKGRMELYPENEKIRKSIEYRLWREAVFARDNWTCRKTRVQGGKIAAHHINNFADFPELRLAIDNGITLSREVHNEFHKIYGKRNNTIEQLEEFLNNKV